MPNGEDGLSLDDVLDALTALQRRKLLVALLEYNPQDDSPVIVADSPDAVDAIEGLVGMQHVHLPKLREYGLIEWDEDDHEVRKGPKFDEIEPLLFLLADNQDALPSNWLRGRRHSSDRRVRSPTSATRPAIRQRMPDRKTV